MKKIVLLICTAIMIFTSCSKQKEENPLLKDWDTPFGTVPFDQIKVSDYLPAIKQAIKVHDKEIDSICNNTQKPNFQNTIAALDYSGSLLTKVRMVYENMLSVNTNDSLQALQETITPLLSDHDADINLNEKLFNRIKTVWDNQSKENLNSEQKHLLKKTYDSFVRSGALLSKNKKDELKKIKQQLGLLNDKYNANVLAETKNYKLVVSDKNDLKGLPDYLITNAELLAKENNMKGKYIFTLDNSCVLPFLTYCDNRQLRKEIFTARINRCNTSNKYDNNKITAQILTLRAKMANILGYKTFAELTLEDRLAGTPQKVDSILELSFKYSIQSANKDIREFQTLLTKDDKDAKLEGWDMYYYAEKLRKQKYDLDEEQTRPYFEINNVRQGCFDNITRLYGLKFTKLNNIPTYAPDVEVYQVKDSQGKHVGILYFDPFTRKGKVGGAWCTSFTAQHKRNGKNVEPIILVAFNYSKHSSRTTLTADEALTIFHEMGHATNEFLSCATYPSCSGTAVATDLVELPSQIAEHWCMQPQVLSTFAKDQNGKLIPNELVAKMQNASHFNQGFMFTELLAAAYLDIKMHSITVNDTVNIQEMETKLMAQINLPNQIPPRYRSTYFTHVFGGGYAAGYYCYIWSEMLDADAFNAWQETGDIFNKTVSEKFRKYILSEGGMDDGHTQYLKFRGKEPDVKYMLINRGMI